LVNIKSSPILEQVNPKSILANVRVIVMYRSVLIHFLRENTC